MPGQQPRHHTPRGRQRNIRMHLSLAVEGGCSLGTASRSTHSHCRNPEKLRPGIKCDRQPGATAPRRTGRGIGKFPHRRSRPGNGNRAAIRPIPASGRYGTRRKTVRSPSWTDFFRLVSATPAEMSGKVRTTLFWSSRSHRGICFPGQDGRSIDALGMTSDLFRTFPTIPERAV